MCVFSLSKGNKPLFNRQRKMSASPYTAATKEWPSSKKIELVTFFRILEGHLPFSSGYLFTAFTSITSSFKSRSFMLAYQVFLLIHRLPFICEGLLKSMRSKFLFTLQMFSVHIKFLKNSLTEYSIKRLISLLCYCFCKIL